MKYICLLVVFTVSLLVSTADIENKENINIININSVEASEKTEEYDKDKDILQYGDSIYDFLDETSVLISYIEYDFNYDGLQDIVAIVDNDNKKFIYTLVRNFDKRRYDLVDKVDITPKFLSSVSLKQNVNAFDLTYVSFINSGLSVDTKTYTFLYDFSGFYLTEIHTSRTPINGDYTIQNKYLLLNGEVESDSVENIGILNKLNKVHGIDLRHKDEIETFNIGKKPAVSLASFSPNKAYYFEMSKASQPKGDEFYSSDEIADNGDDTVTIGDYIYVLTKNSQVDGHTNYGALYRISRYSGDEEILFPYGSSEEGGNIFANGNDLYFSAETFHYADGMHPCVYKSNLSGTNIIKLSEGEIRYVDHNSGEIFVSDDCAKSNSIYKMDKNGENIEYLVTSASNYLGIDEKNIYFSTYNESIKGVFLNKVDKETGEESVISIDVDDYAKENEEDVNALEIRSLIICENDWIVYALGRVNPEREQFIGNLVHIKSDGTQKEISKIKTVDDILYFEDRDLVLYSEKTDKGVSIFNAITPDFTTTEVLFLEE